MTYAYKVVEVTNIYDEFKRNRLSNKFKEKYSSFGWAVYALIKIGIPKKAKIVIPCENCQLSSSFTKCRCNLAKFIKVEKIYLAARQKEIRVRTNTYAIDIYDITRYMKKEYDINQLTYISTYDTLFVYEINKYVEPKHVFDDSPYESCASGIHFVNTIDEANNYFKEIILHNDFINKINEEVETDGIFSEDRN